MPSRSSLEHPRTIPHQNGQNQLYTCFQLKTAQKTIPFGVAHNYVAYVREYPPGYFVLEGFNIRRFSLLSLLRTGSYCTIPLSGHTFINICGDITGASC